MDKQKESDDKRANIRLALILGAIAMMLSFWPLWYLNQGL